MNNTKRIRDRKGKFLTRKTSWVKLIAVILAFLGLCYLAGQFTGWMDISRLPLPTYYIAPVGRLEEIKIFQGDLETMIKGKHSEIWDGEKFVPSKDFQLVRKAEAATEPPSVEDVVRKHFGEYADQALTCFKSESGLRPNALNTKNRNGTWDIGLAQVNTIHCGKVNATDREDCKQKLFDLETNVRVAKQIFDGRGWNAWYGKACKPFWR